MRAKIMLLHFALPLLLHELLDVATGAATAAFSTVDPIAVNSRKEMGSRSMLGNASVSERDFRFTKSIHKPGPASLRKEKPKNGRMIDDKLNNNSLRIKRSDDFWISSEIDETDDFLKMHAFIVRDEDIPLCDTPADKVTERRYFMCSGVILNENHVLTSATCMNQAHIHEYHIEADLAVLIGALAENSYIIKIAHYEIHPRYIADPNSIHHATNNIALLRLSCSIPRGYVVVPKLPSKRFQDIAHLCCPDRCKLSTVVANSKNQHFIRLINVKHLPSPMHVEVKNVTNIRKHMIGSNLKWNSKVEPENTNKKLSPENLRSRNIRQSIEADDKNTGHSSKTYSKPVVETSNNNEIKRKKSIDNTSQHDDEVIDFEDIKRQIDAANVSEENQKMLTNFVLNSMSDVMLKLLEIVTQHIADVNNIFSYFRNILQDDALRSIDSYQNVSDLIGRSILNYALKEMSLIPYSRGTNCTKVCSKCVTSNNKDVENTEVAPDKLVISSTTGVIEDNKTGSIKEEHEIKTEQENDLWREDKSTVLADHVFCPPLGSPIFANNTLVGLVAYTCDDVQNWVEWEYVNIIYNVRWIRKELQRNLTEIINSSNMDDKL